MAYLRTDDHVRIYYEEHGPIEPKATGSPLVLAYGIGGNADLWDVNVPALAARHRLVLWEPRGHARPDSPGDPTRSEEHTSELQPQAKLVCRPLLEKKKQKVDKHMSALQCLGTPITQ